jgi:regulation of enolase protein 1 (concanavalin A-like superfamily)
MLKTGFGGGAWVNEPSRWNIDGDQLTLATENETDFWRETYYGFVHDNGHAYLLPAEDGFTALLRIRADYTANFDQAGLMLYLDEKHWLKCGVELTDGDRFLSVVVTNGRSDWSVCQPFRELGDFRLRMTVKDGSVLVHASPDGKTWSMLRVASFAPAPRYRVGPMACSPSRAGLEVAFSDFSIGPASTEPLHADM